MVQNHVCTWETWPHLLSAIWWRGQWIDDLPISYPFIVCDVVVKKADPEIMRQGELSLSPTTSSRKGSVSYLGNMEHRDSRVALGCKSRRMKHDPCHLSSGMWRHV